MNREDLKKLIVGPIATVPTPFDDDFQVDFGRMYELTQWWVENGLVKGKAVIKVAAAMGEGPQLDDWEWQRLLRTAVQAADGRATVMCGLHYKDTIRAVQDAKIAQDLGAVGLQVSSPSLNGPTQDDVVRHFADVCAAVDIGVMAYVVNNMPGGTIYPETFRRMADFDTMVALKWTPPPGGDYHDIADMVDVVNIIDNTKDPVRNHKMGGRGYINWTAEIHPPHDLKVWDLLESRRYDEAQQLWDFRAQATRGVQCQAPRKVRRAGAPQEGAYEGHGAPRWRLQAPVAAGHRRRTGGAGGDTEGVRLACAGARRARGRPSIDTGREVS